MSGGVSYFEEVGGNALKSNFKLKLNLKFKKACSEN